MANGKAAMELMGQWAPGADAAVATDRQGLDENLGWFPFPTVEGGAGDPSDVLGGGDGFAVGKNAPPETIDFVRYLTSLDTQKAMATAGIAVPPTVKGAETGAARSADARGAASAPPAPSTIQLYYDQYMPPAVGRR